MLTYDVVIIGSGIAGMTSAIYLKRAGIKVLIIEGEVPGGQLNKSFVIENYPGYSNISGPDLAFNIYSQVKALDINYIYDIVRKVDFDNKKITCANDTIKYNYLIIASGRSPRKLNIANIDKLKGISYCALCDGNLYKEKDVAVLGGGNSALEDALYLSGICHKVTIIQQYDRFTGEENLIQRVLSKDNIEVKYSQTITAFTGDRVLEGIITSQGEEIPVSGLFICIGYAPNSAMYALEKDGDYILVNDKMETSINGVYACGDIIKKEFYQLTTATGEATIAASGIVRQINKK